MVIYFVPVEEDAPSWAAADNVQISWNEDESFSGQDLCDFVDFGAPARGRYKSMDTRQLQEEKEEATQLKFAKHKMTASDRDFVTRGSNLRYPLKRIRQLPIRAFLRGAVFFDQTKPPGAGDAQRLSAFLQSRYDDAELLSMHAYSVLIKQRARLLPASDEYYRRLNAVKQSRKKVGGVYDLHFTRHARQNKEVCVVCMDECIARVMVDCYHMCLCADCAAQWTMSCPVCRANVAKIVKEDELDKAEVRIIPMAVSA